GGFNDRGQKPVEDSKRDAQPGEHSSHGREMESARNGAKVGETLEGTIAFRVVVALRDDIVSMSLKPGDVISESDIAGRYGVSRQPLREAFIRLAQQGLLLIRPKRATVVKKISPDGVRQSRFIRESIEVEIVRRVAADPAAKAAEVLAGLIA